MMTQSTALTVPHRSAVGPGTLSPQRNRITAGSPQAAVARLEVARRLASARESGRPHHHGCAAWIVGGHGFIDGHRRSAGG